MRNTGLRDRMQDLRGITLDSDISFMGWVSGA